MNEKYYRIFYKIIKKNAEYEDIFFDFTRAGVDIGFSIGLLFDSYLI